jgi:hypothetical protein
LALLSVPFTTVTGTIGDDRVRQLGGNSRALSHAVLAGSPCKTGQLTGVR